MKAKLHNDVTGRTTIVEVVKMERGNPLAVVKEIGRKTWAGPRTRKVGKHRLSSFTECA